MAISVGVWPGGDGGGRGAPRGGARAELGWPSVVAALLRGRSGLESNTIYTVALGMAFYVRLVLTASLWILFALAVGGATLHADESGGAGKLWSVVTVVFGWSGQPDYIDAQPAAPEEEWSMVVAAGWPVNAILIWFKILDPQ
ncbi:hypothetical protein OsJ_23747 [Oryza sativa Japonica Group]|uniref:Uncharacterized protein n=1 Tax=Oryza sativa subsp. japonica TaxID=39947 RepID=A3BIC9_ORYSJ|nr:hypothetical protein OsJ_23747 [Oryza sativa Japonica Group]